MALGLAQVAVVQPPAAPPAPPVQVLPATAPGGVHTSTFLKDSGKPRQKPTRMGDDVWAVLEEYIRDGGLLDMAEDVASLAETERLIREADGIAAKDRMNLLIKVAAQRTAAKERYQKLQEARRRYITFDQYAIFLEELLRILQARVQDPATIQLIGRDLRIASSRIFDSPTKGG